MDNGGKIILDLCGGTGAWSKPYKDAGYEVEVITLPKYNVTQVDFDAYGMEFRRMDLQYNDSLCILYEDVYGILAAPPCTEFSLAKGNKPRDFETGMKIVDACLKIIWHCRFSPNNNLRFWALENPTGFLRQFLGKPAFTFEQWQFGEMTVKRTDIWGYFKEPVPLVREKPDRVVTTIGHKSHGRDWAKLECPPEYAHLNLTRADIRAITPPGFAQAFFKANRRAKTMSIEEGSRA